MKGHIRRRGRKSWAIVVDVGRDADGKRRQRWHTIRGTKRNAERELTRLLHSLDSGEYIEPTKLTVAEYLKRWLTEYAKSNTSGRTYERYEGIVRCNIVPRLGHYPLARLQPLQIQEFYTWCLASGRVNQKGGLSAQTVVHLHRVLHEALGQAVRWQLLVRNPAAAVEPPRAARREMKVLTERETGELLRVLEGQRLYLPVLLAVTTGMRRGEITALTWNDVDLKHSTVTVTKSLEQTRKGLVVKEPKTGHSRRTIPLPSFVMKELNGHKVEQGRDRLLLGGAYRDQGLVCASPDGTPWKPDALSKTFQVFVRSCDLPQIRFHDLRHIHATQLLKQSTHPKVVAERLGHSSVMLTLDTYSHVIPGLQEEAARQLDRVLRKAIKERSS